MAAGITNKPTASKTTPIIASRDMPEIELSELACSEAALSTPTEVPVADDFLLLGAVFDVATTTTDVL